MSAFELRYPIGPFQKPGGATPAQRAAWIAQIEALPERLRAAVVRLTNPQLDTPYRPGGWTVRQVVHHVADSHTNAYVRFRCAVTEEAPTIKAYAEKAWAELDDARTLPPDVSLSLLAPLHARWVHLLRALDDDAWARTWHNPESGTFRLDEALAQYAWHGRHHTAHITTLREREGW